MANHRPKKPNLIGVLTPRKFGLMAADPSEKYIFPDELKRSPRWVLYRVEERRNSSGQLKKTKVPYRPNGQKAESNDAATWSSYSDCRKALSKFDGLGCMISDPYVAVDFDHVRNKETGEIEPWALAAIKSLDSYTEISPSGEGMHVWCYGKVPAGRKRGRVEIYAEKRYFTVTFNPLPGFPLTINELPKEFYKGVETLDPQEKKPAASEKRTTLSSQHKLLLCMTGNWKATGIGDGSQSAADLFLCGELAKIHNGDAAKMDADFRNGPLMRAKWDERHGAQTYAGMTIAQALATFKTKPISTANWGTFSDVIEEVIEWLWKDRIALGKLNLFTGKPDMAKSMIAVFIAAVLTAGLGQWPDGEPNTLPASEVIFLCAEDDIADTVKPRFRAAGGDAKKAHYLRSMVDVHKDTQVERSFALDRDIAAIRERIEQFPNIKLLILDPISAYFSSEKSINSEQDVREVLEPLRLLCAEAGVAVIGLAHFNKTIGIDAIQKTLGATALTAIMRMGWAFIESEEGNDTRLMLCFKGNLTGKRKRGLKYSTEGIDLEFPGGKTANIGRVKWIGDSEADINEQLNTPAQDKEKLRDAGRWLREELKDSEWQRVKNLNGKAAHDIDCSKSTLQRAARRLKVEKRGRTDAAEWRLPPQQAKLTEEGF